MIGLLACLVSLGREIGQDFQTIRYFAYSIFSQFTEKNVTRHLVDLAYEAVYKHCGWND